MSGPEQRLGDIIDDYCPRCRLLLNHAIASMVEGQVVKVICQTCYSEHAYLHARSGKKSKLPSSRTTLFDQVLAVVVSSTSAPQTPGQKKKGAGAARYISRHKTRPRKSS